MENQNQVFQKRIKIGNIAFVCGILILTIGCWNEYSWYEVMAPLGTLISFIFLGVTLLCYVDIRTLVFDKMFILMVAADVVTLVHLFIVGSGKGAFLTVCDLLLVLYLTEKIILPKKARIFLMCYIGFYFLYWTIDVKGYFKGYNTNYGGLVLITGFVFAIMAVFCLRDELIKRGKQKLSYVSYVLLVILIAIGYNIIAWYRARCALLGFIVYLVLIICPKKMWKNKVLYALLRWALTFGAIIISLVYVFLGKNDFTIEIFYKNIISGREEIWAELWNAYLHSPFLGIGSSYKMQIPWMDGMFEVHNGLLDILFVHGLSVFAIVMVMLLGLLKRLGAYAAESMPQKCALSGMYAILAASFMENFFIVPPFLLCFMVLGILVLCRKEAQPSA